MRVIWKYPLYFTSDGQTLAMPDRSRILCVQIQDNTICLWAYVNPDAMNVKRVIEILSTGQEVSNDSRAYIGTVQIGSMVWHVFEKIGPQ